jgi:Predicted hydrolases of HD superfamily
MNTAPWITLKDGSDYDFTIPLSSRPPSVEVIAHSLSLLNRFAGHTHRPYSVAEHSCLCLEIARRYWPEESDEFYLTILCHDAAEAVTGDLASPVKRVLGDPWRDFESRIEEHVLNGLYPGLFTSSVFNASAIKRVDLTALWIERRDMLVEHTRKWAVLDDPSFEPIPFPPQDPTERIPLVLLERAVPLPLQNPGWPFGLMSWELIRPARV